MQEQVRNSPNPEKPFELFVPSAFVLCQVEIAPNSRIILPHLSKTMKRRILNAAAPIRICDIGGWTDTWFAGHGTIFNIAVYPYVKVQIHIVDAADLESRVVINLENFNERFLVDPKQIAYDKHPLIEAALDVMAIPDDVSFEVNIFSTAPPGASNSTFLWPCPSR